ncbi:hypothetical protein GCM10014719_01620 [Planomonospora parontospora subsp. antibiotica]|nr:hypothetical protein GCM10014719_01620 [Planomonospora parontospora subsp. antibiotica]GII13322.1 hypothetical protein Ppa05_00480 [Planomonospora parontospora subsp. antibiotica]
MAAPFGGCRAVRGTAAVPVSSPGTAAAVLRSCYGVVTPTVKAPVPL